MGFVGSQGSGAIALAHSERTLASVSAPSRVVRSIIEIIEIIEIAVSTAQALDVFLMERVPKPCRACVCADLVDTRQPVQSPRQRSVGECSYSEHLARAGSGDGRTHRRRLSAYALPDGT
jgi:hypothetical protein